MCYSVPASNMSHKLLNSLLMCVLVFFFSPSFLSSSLINLKCILRCASKVWKKCLLLVDWFFFSFIVSVKNQTRGQIHTRQMALAPPSELFWTNFDYLLTEVRNRWVCLKCLMLWPDVVVHTWNPSTQGGLQTLGQPGLHGDSPSQIILFNICITVKMNMTVTSKSVKPMWITVSIFCLPGRIVFKENQGLAGLEFQCPSVCFH